MIDIPGLTKHKKTGMYWFRRRIPDDLRTHYKKTEYKVTLGTKVREHAELLAAKEYRATTELWETVRYRRKHRKPLTERDAEAVAGEMYRLFLAEHRSNPLKAQDYITPGLMYWYCSLYGPPSEETGMHLFVRNKVGKQVLDIVCKFGIDGNYKTMPLVYYRVARALGWAHAYMFCYLKGDLVEDRHETMFPPILVKIHRFDETPFHKGCARRLTRIMAAARTKKASAEDGVAS